MERLCKLLVGAVVLLCLLHTGSALRCTRENIWGQTEHFYCPEVGDDPDKRFCCGLGDDKFCCSTASHEEFIDNIVENLPTIMIVIGAFILGIIVLCIVCCCCCPFCLLYKRRNRGTVHNPNPDVSVMQPLQNQPENYVSQPQASYPTQPSYAPQPGYPSQPSYPPQPYPPTGYPNEQPPTYTEKQPPPYNPLY